MKNIVFFEGTARIKDLPFEFDFKENNWIFVNIKELMSKESTFKRFMENELKSIPFLFELLTKLRISKIFSKFLFRNQKKNDSTGLSDKLENVQVKLLTEYVSREVYNKADELANKIFESIKDKDIIRSKLIFEGYNLFETNRLEFAVHFYELAIKLLSIKDLLDLEQPSHIYVLPSVSVYNKYIIKTVLSKKKDGTLNTCEAEINNNLNFKRVIISLQPLIERLWYWTIWKMFNRVKINPKKLNLKSHKIIFFSQYKNYFPSLVEVLNQLKVLEKTSLILYLPHKHYQFAKKLMFNTGLNDVILLPFSDRKYSSFIRNYDKYKIFLTDLISTPEFKDIKVDSLDIARLIKLSFFYLHEKMVNSFRYVENFSHTLKSISPDLICLLGGNDAMDVLATRIAKNLGTKTLFFQHGLIAVKYDYRILEQDYIICAGEKEKDFFLSFGNDPNKIKPLGLPLYDKLFRKFLLLRDENLIRESVREKFKLHPEKKIVLLLTSNVEDFIRERVFKTVTELSKASDDLQVLIKIHPVEEVSYYQKLAEEHGVQYIPIVKDFDLHDLIISSDVVIGRNTGAQIEAILLGKDVLNLSFEIESDFYLMKKFNAALTVSKPRDLRSAIEKALFNEDVKNRLKAGRESYRSYAIHKFDGKAALRVKDLIEKIIRFN